MTHCETLVTLFFFFSYDFSDLKLKASLWADSEKSQSFYQILLNLFPLWSSAQLHKFIHTKNEHLFSENHFVHHPVACASKIYFGTAVSLKVKATRRYFGNNI